MLLVVRVICLLKTPFLVTLVCSSDFSDQYKQSPVDVVLLLPHHSRLEKMADWVAYAYSAAVAAGGLMGYVKKGSIMSGIMGVAFGRYVNELLM